MIRTKGQNMLRCSGQNANEKLGRTKSPVGIVSGWHFIQLAFCLTTLFNHMSWWPIPKKSRSSVISVIFQALKFFIWKDTSIITQEINPSSATSATFLWLNLAKLVNTILAFLKFAIAIVSLAPNKIRSSPVEYLQPWGKFFIGITLPELTPLVLTGMVEGQWTI